MILFKRKASKISGVDAISELEKVTIGDIEQWIYIRGENCHLPILLMLRARNRTNWFYEKVSTTT